MYCSNCGVEVTGNFCANCGTKVGEVLKTPESLDTNNVHEVAEMEKNNFLSIIVRKAKGILEKGKESFESMPKKTRVLIIVIAAVILILFILLFGGSGSDSSYNSSGSSYTATVTTTSSAISKAKDALNLDQRICSALGFKQFYQPDFGVCDADEDSDGSWTVTLKGKMSGYLDEYQSDFETRKFEAVVEVLSTGSAYVKSVSREY